MEPSVQALSGLSPGRVLKRYLLATRPMFFPASLLPVAVGSSWGAWTAGRLDGVALLLALAAIACVHGAVNVLNDVYDDVNGTDRANDGRVFPYTGGSRFIQNGVLSRDQMQRWAWALLGMALAPGVGLYLLEGPPVVLFGLSGIALGVLYSVPPFSLAARGFGELAVAVGFGVLPVIGAAWLQGAGPDWYVLLLSLPVSVWVVNILLVNELPDAIADAGAGKRTLVVRLGGPATATLYALLAVVALIAAFGLAMAAKLSLLGLVPMGLLLLLSLDVGRRIIGVGGSGTDERHAIHTTLTIHGLGCAWLTVWPWL